MPLNPIPAVPAFSGPLPTQSDLVNYETNSSRYMTEAPVVIAGMNAAITGINQIAVAAQQAAALIGFRGLWSEQTGALARPASVLHENELWALASDVADVTAHEPSEASAVWALVRESAERVAYGESTVAAALDSLGLSVGSLNAASPGVILNSRFSHNSRGVASGSVTLSANQRAWDCWKAGASGAVVSLLNGVVTVDSGTLVYVVDEAVLTPGTWTLSQSGTAPMRLGAGDWLAGPRTITWESGHVTAEFGVGTVDRPRFAPGAVALPWVPYGASERAALDRYEQVVPLLVGPSNARVWLSAPGSVAFFSPEFHAARMRTTPSLTATNNSSIQYLNSSGVWTNTTLTLSVNVLSGVPVVIASGIADLGSVGGGLYVRRNATGDVFVVLSAAL